MFRPIILAMAICGAAGPLAKASTVLIVASHYNVFTLGNFTTSGNGDTQGALAAAGVVTINNYAVGYSSPSSSFNLVAGTNLVASNGSVNGKVYDGGSGGIASSFTIGSGNLTTGGSGPVDFADTGAQLRATSTGLAGMSTAGDTCGLNYYWLTCTATQHGLNVIDLPAADLAYLNTSHGFQVNSTYSDATIVINVPGTSDSTPNSWLFSGTSAQHVLLNFSSAASLTLSSYVGVSVLAPNATVNAPAPGHLDGTFIAGSFSSGQYQFNSAPFTGTLPDFSDTISAAPEPASTALVGMSLFGIALLCSKTRKK